MRKIIILVVTVFLGLTGISQDFSNKGKDFWVAYGYHQVMNAGGGGGNGQEMVLYVATDVASVVTVEMPGLGYSQTYNIPANTIFTTPTFPKAGAQDARLNVAGLSDRGIHITSDFPVVAYAHIYNASVSGACMLLPTSTLGKEYYSINYTNNSNTANSNCWFYVIATEPGSTDVEITPSAAAIGLPAGVPFTVTLQQGQVYNVMGTTAGNFGTDLTGSIVKSLAGAGQCKRISVFSGSGRIFINCGAGGTSSDNYMVQSFPKTAWGRKYLTVPTAGSMPRNIYRVCVSNPAAVVTINGVVTTLPLISNFYYEIPATNVPQLIESDLPITVSQYVTTQNSCGNSTPGDPEVIYLSSIEQNIKDVLFNSNLLVNTAGAPHQHWVNAVIPNSGSALSSFRIDGLIPTVPFVVHPQNPAYSYIQVPLTLGQHRMVSDSGFNAIAYGFATTESYGYNAGTNVRDLTQQLELETTYGIETSPSVCTNSPFKFKVYFPDSTLSATPAPIRYDSLQWRLTNSSLIVPNNFPILVPGTVGTPPTVLIDSTNIRSGRQVNWYSLPGTYLFNAPGLDTLIITAYRSTNEGCGTSVEYVFPIQISDPPVGDFTWTPSGCVTLPYQFNETTPQLPKPTYRWYWNFGDPGSGASNTSVVRNPLHLFSAPGTYTVKYVAYTTPGCVVDTITKTTIVVPDLPNAAIAGNITTCINSAQPTITFTGSLGTPEYIFNYTIDNGSGPGPVISTLPSVAGVATILAPTNVAGTFIYNLVSVQNVGTAACIRNISGQSVTVTITPDATITLTSATGTNNQVVCINNPITNITYSVGGSGNGGSVTGLPAGVTGTYAAGVITITGIPTVSGVFPYTVITTGPCIIPTATGTITVTADATLNLTSAAGSDNQTLCINTPLLVNITYAVGGTGTSGIVTGLPAGVTGVFAGGTITISGTPTVSGVFPYTVNTAGPCVIPTATGTITVTADGTLTLTSAAGTNNQSLCINIPIINITYSVGGTGTGGTVTGLPAGVTGTFAGGVITITGTPAISGVFPYTVNTTGPCIIPTATGTITVTADATLNLTSAAGSDNQTLCINTPLLLNITYAVGGTGTSGIVTGLPAGVTGVFAGGTITISGTPTVSGVFPFTVITTGPCVIPTATGTITVTADGTLTLTSAAGTNNQSLCINVPVTNITYSVGGTATGGSVAGLPAGVSGVFAAGIITISGTPTVTGTFPFTVTTTGPCVIPTATGTITVNPDAGINLTSAPPTTTQELCRNSTITNITYSITGGGTGATVTGLPAGVTGVYAGGIFTISGSPSVAGTFPYTVNTTGTCIQANATGTITVNLLPTAAFNSSVPSCETRTIYFTDLSVPNVGVLNGWTWNFGDPGSGAANTSTLQNPAHSFAAAGSYTVTLSVTNDKGCISNPIASVPVIINNRPAAGFIIPEVCLSDTYAQFLDTSSIVFGSVNGWEWNFGDPNATVPNPNTSILQNPTHSYTAVGSYNVRLIVTSNTGCKDTITHILIVNGSFPVANFSVLNPTTLCANDSVSIVEASTVFPGVITKVEIYWDNVGFPAVFEIDNSPFTGKIYRHLYPNFQAPLVRTFTIRYRAYSGGVCVNDRIANIVVNAAPLVQFNNMPNSCLLIPPFQITQASETGGVPGIGVYTGPGVSPTGIFTPGVAGIGTHTILYTFTSAVGGCVDTMSNTITVLDTAHAVFSHISPTCEQVPTSFTDLSTAPATVVLANTVWNFGDGTPVENHAPGSTFGHVFAAPGSYSVTMYNVSAFGCNSTVTSQTVSVSANHAIVLNAGSNNNQNLCINSPLTDIVYTLSGGATGATVTGLPAGVTYSIVGNQLTISGAPSPLAGGPVFIFTILTTGNTCVIASANGTITVQPDHTIAYASGDTVQSVCVNTAINPFTYTIGGGAAGVAITGLPPGVGFVVAGNLITISGTPNTTAGGPDFPFTITTTGNACLRATAIGSIKVNPYPVTDFTPDKPDYCIPNAIVQFINGSVMPDGSGMTYVWNFGDGSPLNTGVSPTHWFATTGPFNVKLSATSLAVLNGGIVGCTTEKTVVVNRIHPQPKADFKFNKPSVCVGDRVTITDNTDGRDGIVNQWHWDFGNGITDNRNPLTYLFADTITYNITLYSINNFGCNSDTITKPFTVYPYPHVNAGPDKVVLEGGSVQLESVTFANNPQYLWTPDLYLSDARIPRPRVLSPRTDMTYRLTVTGNGGCASTDNVFVKLLKFPVIPNTFTPNNDGINDKWRIDYLNTYPENRVQIFTRSGQLVFESKGYNTPWDGTLKGKPLPFDTYYYIIEPGNGRDPITGYVTIIK